MRTALTIAGSDPTGGAGIQADLRTFAAFRVSGVSAITAITAQNAAGVRDIFALAPKLVAAQIDAVLEDRAVDAVKIGMLANAAILGVVAEAIERHQFPNVVLDPVIRATTGGQLLEAAAIDSLRTRLFPLVAVVTPNLDELRVLSGIAARDVGELREAAARLVDLGARAVVAKGGHLPGAPVDVVYDGRTFTELAGERIAAGRTHGTGCMFSSALAAGLALGDTLVDAARAAKAHVFEMITRQT